MTTTNVTITETPVTVTLSTAGPQGATGPAPEWGNITGTLGDQTDLAGELAGKAALGSQGWNIQKAGRWITSSHATRTTLVPLADIMYGALLPVHEGFTLDRIGIEITSSGSAGSLVRLGIFKADANRADFTRVLDAGTIDGTQAAGVYAITISQALTAGLHLLVAVSQGGPTTRPTLRAGVGGLAHLMNAPTQLETAGSVAQSGLYLSSVSGALPASSSLIASTSNSVIIFGRIA